MLALNAAGALVNADSRKEQTSIAASERAMETLSAALAEHDLAADLAIALAQCRCPHLPSHPIPRPVLNPIPFPLPAGPSLSRSACAFIVASLSDTLPHYII